ncbi:VWA domain-containing protein [Akkermansiaceae bacterium]|nr:VWA domain-containing protein [Akkermansiaceae bacterium]
MSIHAKLSPEAQARLASQRRNSTISSLVIAFLTIVILGLVLGFFLLPNLIKETPTIVTYKANETKADEPEPEKIKSAIQRKPSSPSSSMVKVIAATTTADISIPVPDVAVTTESVEFGDGEDFGGGWGDGMGSGKGGGASFFNQKVSAERIAYVIDYSGSMAGEKDKLMRNELTKSVSGLNASTKFQMIFFSGPAWVAGSDATASGPQGSVKAKGGHTYKWTGKGAHDWKPVGKRQSVEWLDMTSSQMAESLKVIKESKLVWGTDWTNPLEMAFDMEPPPQIVFFMTDGQMSGRDMMGLTRDLAAKAKRKGIVVNSIAMMEPKAEEAMFELAKRTGGAFTIVDKGGKVREVKSLKKK